MTEPAPSAGAERTLQAERAFAWVVLVAAVVFGVYCAHAQAAGLGFISSAETDDVSEAE